MYIDPALLGPVSVLLVYFSIEALRKVAGEMVKYTSDACAVFKKFYIEQAVETFGHPNA